VISRNFALARPARLAEPKALFAATTKSSAVKRVSSCFFFVLVVVKSDADADAQVSGRQ
jgi:hypothetical protein